MARPYRRTSNRRSIAPLFIETLENRLLLAMPTSWVSVGVGGGGAIFAPSFSPYNASEIYIATDMSDQYHSTDLGATWSVLNFQQIQGQSHSPVQFTNVPGLLYGLGSGGQPIKSTDNGATWASVPGGSVSGITLLADPNNSSRFIVGGGSAIYLTTNGGSSYASIGSSSAYLAGAFFDGSNIYIATDKGIMVSTNGGGNFTLSYTPGTGKTIASTEGIVSFAAAKSGSMTRFFVVTATDSQISSGGGGEICYQYKGTYTLDVGQSDWTKLTGIPAGTDPAYVAMTTGDINTVYIGGGSTSNTPTVIKSTNGGASWTSVFNTTNNQNIQGAYQCAGGDIGGWGWGELAEGFAVSPTDASKVIISDMGGAYLSADGGATWKAVYVSPADLSPAGSPVPKGKSYHDSGLDPTSAWSLTWSDPNNIMESVTDIKATRSTDGGMSWSFNYTGDSYNTMYQSVVQPTTGTLYAAVSSIHDMYQWRLYICDQNIDGGTGEVLYSTDKGATWNVLHNFAKPVVWETLDPNSPNRMFVSVVNHAGSGTAGGIYVCNDISAGASSVWTKLANPLRTEGHPFNIVVLNDGTLVCTYAGRLNAASGGDFTASSGVFVGTYNASTSTVTWTDRSAANMDYFTRDITVDPSDPTQSTWWVGVWSMWGSSAGKGGLYKTTDRGQDWTLVPGTAAMGSVTQVAINPTNYNEMYVCTSGNGLYYTSNAQATTPTFVQVTSYPFGTPTRVFFDPYNPREIWITSFGNGMRMGFDNSGLLAGDANMDGKASFADYLVLEQSFGKSYQIWTNGDFNGDGKVSFADYLLLEANFGKSTTAPSSQDALSVATATSLSATAGPLAMPSSATAEQVRQFVSPIWQPLQLENVAKAAAKAGVNAKSAFANRTATKLLARRDLNVDLLN